MTVDISLQHKTRLIGSFCRSHICVQAEDKSINRCISDQSDVNCSFKVYHINRLKEMLGHDVCSQMIFIHLKLFLK